MPTVDHDFNRTCTRLDLDPELSGIFTPDVAAALRFTADDLRRFNACVAGVAPGAPPLDARHIAGAARRLSRAVGPGNESRFIQTRIRRACEMRALLHDAAWSCLRVLRERMQLVVDYIDGGPGLVPDDTPAIGGLDDALLVDLAMESLRGELDEYADFCRYRAGEAARLGVAPEQVQLDRNAWRTCREEEILMERQMRRLAAGTYAPAGAGAALFRVS